MLKKDLAELWLVEFVSVISNKLNIDKKKKVTSFGNTL